MNLNDPPSLSSEQTLLEQYIQHNDLDALDRLYRSFGPRLQGYVHRILGDEAKAKDIVNETFLRLQQNRERLETPLATRWLIRVGHNLAINELRTRERYEELKETGDPETYEAAGTRNPAADPYHYSELGSQPPASADEMMKFIEQNFGLSQMELEDLRKLNSDFLWINPKAKKVFRRGELNHRLDYPQFAREQEVSEAAAYQRVSRLQRRGVTALKRIGGMKVFQALTSHAKALTSRVRSWLRQCSPSGTPIRSIIGGVFILFVISWWLASGHNLNLQTTPVSLTDTNRVVAIASDRAEGIAGLALLRPPSNTSPSITVQPTQRSEEQAPRELAPEFWREFFSVLPEARDLSDRTGRQPDRLLAAPFLITDLADMSKYLLVQGLQEVEVERRIWLLSEIPNEDPTISMLGRGSRATLEQLRVEGLNAAKLEQQLINRLKAPERTAVTYFVRSLNRLKGGKTNFSLFSHILDVGGYLMFWPEDIKDLPALATRLSKGTDPISAYLYSQLQESTRQMLMDTNSQTDLKEKLAENISEALLSDSFYAEDRFSATQLSAQTKSLLGGVPKGEALARRNRALLQDAFPAEVVRNLNLYREPELTTRMAAVIHDTIFEEVVSRTTSISINQVCRTEQQFVCVCSLNAESSFAPKIRVMLVAELKNQWLPRVFFLVFPAGVNEFVEQNQKRGDRYGALGEMGNFLPIRW